EGAHEKSPKCLGWKFRGFWGILQRSQQGDKLCQYQGKRQEQKGAQQIAFGKTAQLQQPVGGIGTQAGIAPQQP
ncbi:hypothetical protein, partial [Eikenella corrodens]|uniref:hypothetical protein n=1 Tax=Eikenella corrodens TaxID=539 RepID=UPI00195E897B